MKLLFAVLFLILWFTLPAGATEHASLIRIKAAHHHKSHPHAHKATKHHAPKHQHNSV